MKEIKIKTIMVDNEKDFFDELRKREEVIKYNKRKSEIYEKILFIPIIDNGELIGYKYVVKKEAREFLGIRHLQPKHKQMIIGMMQ